MPGELDTCRDATLAARKAADAARGAFDLPVRLRVERPTRSFANVLFGADVHLASPPPLAAAAVQTRVEAARRAPPALEPHPIPPRRALELVESLFRDHPGSLVRERCRDEMFADDDGSSVRDLVYGEFTFMSLVSLLRVLRPHLPPTGGVCVDLGSGVGRPAFAAAALHPFSRVVGVEILRNLHALGQELARLYDAETRPALGGHRAPVVQLARGDFLADGGAAWADADLVLVNSCCFSDETFHRLERVAAAALKPGTIVVTVRRQFKDAAGTGTGTDTETGTSATWELLEAAERRMSWGPSTTFAYRRTEARAPARETREGRGG